MADKKAEELKITRRQFIAGTGAVLVLGAVPNLAAGALETIKTENQWRCE